MLLIAVSTWRIYCWRRERPEREIAVRGSMGATRQQIFAQFLTQS